MSDQWQSLQELFHKACDLGPDERAAFLETLAGDQRKALASLLRHDTVDARSSLDAVADQALQLLTPNREQIGPYRVIERIGTGGMGSVYLARREADFEQQVAIKIVPTIFERAELLERFRAERQILADLNHPNIAQLLDGGTTEDGLPYLVMEYVRGLPIDEYCRTKQLDTAATLTLFMDVCDAVQHAHQRLVIHRDIKPDNILVTENGVVKLLDFGVAKLTEAGVDQTLTKLQMMTPGYASPEQVMRLPLATTSDVYSLGVLLYQLLTDQPPYSLAACSSRVIEKIVCEENPAPPSSIRPQLRGDIDQIVMMAMRKEPERRYPSASAFAADIRRFVEGYPVQAMPDSFKYRAGKYFRRNTVPLMASLATIITLAIAATFVVSSMDQARTATLLARQKAISTGQAAQFLATVLSQASPFRGDGKEPSMRDLLESSARDVASTFEDEPALQTMLYAEIAKAMADIGEGESAHRVMQLAVDKIASARNDTAAYKPALVESLIRLSGLPLFEGDYAAAQVLLQEAATLIPDQGPERPALQARLELERAKLEFAMDTPDGGLASVERALAILGNIQQEEPVLYAEALSQMGKSLAVYGPKPDEGLELMRIGLQLKEAVVGELHPSLLVELDNYVSYLVDAESGAKEIEAIARQQEAIVEKHFGKDSVWRVYPVWTWGRAYEVREQWGLAEQSFETFLSIAQENGYTGMPLIWGAQDVGWAAFRQGKYAKAEQHFRLMLESATAAFGEKHWGIGEAHLYLSAVAAARGDTRKARDEFGRFLANQEEPLELAEFENAALGFLHVDDEIPAMIDRHNRRFAK